MAKPRKKKLSWVKKQKKHAGFKRVRVKTWDEIRDFRMDPGCYVLIRIYRGRGDIGVAVCAYDHSILMEFVGKTAKDLYNRILRHDEDQGNKWFRRFDHAAYLGKELRKAEDALQRGRSYYQE